MLLTFQGSGPVHAAMIAGHDKLAWYLPEDHSAFCVLVSPREPVQQDPAGSWLDPKLGLGVQCGAGGITVTSTSMSTRTYSFPLSFVVFPTKSDVLGYLCIGHVHCLLGECRVRPNVRRALQATAL